MRKETVKEPCWGCGSTEVEVETMPSLFRPEPHVRFHCAAKTCPVRTSYQTSLGAAHKNWCKVARAIRTKKSSQETSRDVGL